MTDARYEEIKASFAAIDLLSYPDLTKTEMKSVRKDAINETIELLWISRKEMKEFRERQAKENASLTPSAMGAKGGAAKVPKGFSMLTKKQRSVVAKKAAAKRWGKS